MNEGGRVVCMCLLYCSVLMVGLVLSIDRPGLCLVLSHRGNALAW